MSNARRLAVALETTLVAGTLAQLRRRLRQYERDRATLTPLGRRIMRRTREVIVDRTAKVAAGHR